jgi:hypothetical protein
MRYLIVLIVLLLLIVPVSAKGPSDRIVFTGPTIEGELVVTDPTLTMSLSMASLEDFMAGALTEPENPGDVYYELERQFVFQKGRPETFDRARYYPEVQAVHYIGIENGSSEYDGKWYPATDQGIGAIEALLTASPYIILMDSDGSVEFVDPATLEPMTQIEIGRETVPAPQFIGALDTDTLYFKSEDFHHRLLLDTGHYCVSEQAPLMLREGLLSFNMMPDLARYDSGPIGADHESIRLVYNHRMLVYEPNAPGIQVVTLGDGVLLDEWQTDTSFAQVVAGGDYLYALENGGESTQLHVLNAESGEMVDSRALDGTDWSVGYAWLRLDGLESGAVVDQC